MGVKLLLGGITFLGTVDAVYNLGKKFKIIPSKENIEETIERKPSNTKIIEKVIETKQTSNSSMTWQEFLWGSNKTVKPINPKKEELIEKIVTTEVPSGKDIIANSLDTISSSFNNIYYNFLEAIVPYWGYIEIIIAFHLTLFLIVLIAIDILIILRILLLLKSVLKLILQLFGKNDS